MKKKNDKRAFTLVELLGAVVIIAVISLIATPVIMSVVKNSRRTSYLRSTESMGRASSLFYSDNTELFSNQKGIMNFLCENNECSTNYDEDGNLLSATSNIGKGVLAIYPNGDIEYLLSDGEFCVTKYRDESTASVRDGNCDKIDIKKDKTPAELDTFTSSSTTKSITATVTAHDDETGIYGYSCSIDGEHYSEISTNNTCYFPDLKTGTYTVYFKVYNGTYGKDTYNEETSIAIFTKEVATKIINTPEYSTNPNDNTWTQAKTITISAPNESGLTALYSTDGGDTWQEGTSLTVTKNNTTVIAKYTDGVNTVTASTLLVNHIDETAPEVTIGTSATTKNIYVTMTAQDLESGIYRYQYGISSDGINYDFGNVDIESVHTFENLKSGTYYVRVFTYNNAYNNTPETNKNLATGMKQVDATVVLRNCPVPKYTITPSGDEWVQSRSVGINYGSEEGCNGSYSIDNENSWKTGNSVTFTANGNIIAKNTDGVNTVTASTLTVTKIDISKPESISFSTSQTTNSITVTASGVDSQSGIARYAFSKDNGSNWTAWQTGNVYTFDKLVTNTYNIKVKVYNGTYGSVGATDAKGVLESPARPVTLVGCSVPTYSYANNDATTWTQSKLINISGSSGFKTKYRLNNTGDFIEGSSVNIAANNTDLTAIVTDETNTCSASTLQVKYIDRTVPSSVTNSTSRTNNSITVTTAATDVESGITGYSYRINGGDWTAWQTSNVHTFPGLSGSTTYTIQSRVHNGTYGTIGASDSLNITESGTSSVTTLSNCPVPTVSLSPSGSSCATTRTATINYGSVAGCTGTYSTDGGSTWKSGTSVVFYNNGTLIARNVDGSGTVKMSSTQSVPCTDNNTPSASLTVTSNGSTISNGGSVSTTTVAKLTCSNSGSSGIGSYYIEARDTQYSTLISSTNNSSLSFNPASSTSGRITITAYCTTGAGKQSSTLTHSVVYSSGSSSTSLSCTPYTTCGYCSSGYSGSKYYNSSCSCVDACYYDSGSSGGGSTTTCGYKTESCYANAGTWDQMSGTSCNLWSKSCSCTTSSGATLTGDCPSSVVQQHYLSDGTPWPTCGASATLSGSVYVCS